MTEQAQAVARFYAAASEADRGALARVLRDDVRHYLIAPNPGDDPTHDAQAVIESLTGAVDAIGASWRVDHLLIAGQTACVEWSMGAIDPGFGPCRGCEWIEIDGDRIAEFRVYLQTDAEVTELDGYPYLQGIPAETDTTAPGRSGVSSRWLPVIVNYYDACTAADVDALSRCFTDDVVHYFVAPNVGSAPVRGRDHLSRYWRKVARMIDAHWVVESIIERGDEAVIEWSMYWVPVGRTERIVTRGTEWYRFRDGAIAEIRSYHKQLERSTELKGFDYADHGYSTLGHEASRLHPDVRPTRHNG